MFKFNCMLNDFLSYVYFIKFCLIYSIYASQKSKNVVYKVSYLYAILFISIVYLNYINSVDNLGFLVFIEITAIFMYILLVISYALNSGKIIVYSSPFIFMLVFVGDNSPINFLDLIDTFNLEEWSGSNNLRALMLLLFSYNTSLVLIMFSVFITMFIMMANFNQWPRLVFNKKKIVKNINLSKNNKNRIIVNMFKNK